MKFSRILTIFFTIGIALEFSLMAVLGQAGSNRGLNNDAKTERSWLPTATPTFTPTPTPAFGTPAKIEIPAIGVKTGVEMLGIESSGQMQSPRNFANVGWYVNSARPGWQGTSVFSGHFDTNSGAPAVFYNLSRLPVGSDIILIDEIGRSMVYKVASSVSKPIGEWDTSEIFSWNDKERLSLITCSGWWNPTTRSYSHRHIVFADLVEKLRR